MFLQHVPFPATTGGGSGGQFVAVERFLVSAPVGTNTVDLVIPGVAWTPGGARFTMLPVNRNESPTRKDDAELDSIYNASASMGFYDGTNQVCAASTNQNTFRQRFLYNDRCVAVLGTTIRMNATALIPGGVRVQVEGVTNGQYGVYVLVEIFNGNVACGVLPRTAAASPTIGFEADAVFTMFNDRTAGGASSSLIQFRYGLASHSGGVIRQASVIDYLTGQIALDGKTHNDALIADYDTTQTTRLTAVSPTSITLTPSVTGRANDFGWMAVGFGGAAKAYLGIYDAPTVTGMASLTGADFTPEYASILTSRSTLWNTNQTQGQANAISVGAATPEREYSMFIGNWDSEALPEPADRDINISSDKVIYTFDTTQQFPAIATLAGFTETGLELDCAAAAPGKLLALMIGPA